MRPFAVVLLAAVCVSATHARRAVGSGQVDPPINVNTQIPDFVRDLKIGATAETHYVTTNDGYILTVFRMPAKQQQEKQDGATPAKVVYLQHGILASAWGWLVNINGMAPAIRLWEAGYEVWLGNSRGNEFSLNHTTIKVHSKEFWNYTFEEMGERDVPATVDYITTTSGSPTLTYVGWSQGNTAMFIGALSGKPYQPLGGAPATTAGAFIASHVTHHIALSPVVYLQHAEALFLHFFAKAGVGALVEAAFPYSFLDGSEALSLLEHVVCDITVGVVCKLGVDWFCGSSIEDSEDIIDNRFIKHFPAGTSVKDVNHYAQYMASKELFERYDYGEKGNIAEYGQPSPPVFDLKAYPLNVSLFAATHDALVAPKDLEFLQDVLPAATTETLYFKDFSHLTWLVGKSDVEPWLDTLLESVKNHTQS